MRAIKTALLAVMFVACADIDVGPFPVQEDELAAEGADVSEAALGGCPRPCVLGGAPPGQAAIRIKREQLDPGVHDAYFASPATELAKTPDYDAYGQFFSGWAGVGAIYHRPSHGTYAVYGAFLQRWADLGFERGVLQFPTSDAYDVPGGMRQDFYALHLGGPDYEQNCLLSDVRYLIWDSWTGETEYFEEQTYFRDSAGGPIVSEPQQVHWIDSRPVNDIRNIGFNTHPWCGDWPGPFDESAPAPLDPHGI